MQQLDLKQANFQEYQLSYTSHITSNVCIQYSISCIMYFVPYFIVRWLTASRQTILLLLLSQNIFDTQLSLRKHGTMG